MPRISQNLLGIILKYSHSFRLLRNLPYPETSPTFTKLATSDFEEGCDTTKTLEYYKKLSRLFTNDFETLTQEQRYRRKPSGYAIEHPQLTTGMWLKSES